MRALIQTGASAAIKKPLIVLPVTLPVVGKQAPSVSHEMMFMCVDCSFRSNFTSATHVTGNNIILN